MRRIILSDNTRIIAANIGGYKLMYDAKARTVNVQIWLGTTNGAPLEDNIPLESRHALNVVADVERALDNYIDHDEWNETFALFDVVGQYASKRERESNSR